MALYQNCIPLRFMQSGELFVIFAAVKIAYLKAFN